MKTGMALMSLGLAFAALPLAATCYGANKACAATKTPAACSQGACSQGACVGSGAAVAGDMAELPTLSTAALGALLRSGSSTVLLDARSGRYDDGRRIPGAKSLTDQATAEQAAALIPSKDTLVVTYCANLKCPLSGRLAKHLRTLGYTNVVEYQAGIADWTAAGNAVEKLN